MHDPQEPTPYLVLKHVMSPEYRDSVAAWTLDHLADVPLRMQRGLKRAIRSRVDLRGYRDASRARLPLLVRPLAETMLRANDLLAAVLRVWAETHLDLREAIVDHAQEEHLPVLDAPAQEGFVDAWYAGEMGECADRFLQAHDHYDRDDVCLMLCLMTGQAPVPDSLRDSPIAPIREEPSSVPPPPVQDRGGAQDPEDAREHEESPLPRWRSWVEELRALPITAPEWVTVDEFIRAVQDLLAEKQNEDDGRRRLGELLQDLSQKQDEFSYLDLSIIGWDAGVAPPHEITPLQVTVKKLLELAAQLRDARACVPESFAAEQERAQRITVLAKRIRRLHADAARAFCPSSGPPGPTGGGSGDAAVDVPVTSAANDAPAAEAPEAAGSMGPATSVDVPSRENKNGAESASESPSSEGARSVSPHSSQDAPCISGEEITNGAPASQAASGESQESSVTEPLPPSDEPEEITGSADEDLRLEGGARDDRHDGESLDREGQPGEVSSGSRTNSLDEPAVVGEVAADQKHVGMLPAHTVAALLRDGSGTVQWNDLLWALVHEDDLTGAYWLAESMAASDGMPDVPPWLIRAVFASRWLTSDPADRSAEIFATVQNHRLPDDDRCVALGLAAAICGALVAPASGTVDWLNVPSSMPDLHGLVSCIEEYALRGIPLRPEYLHGVAGEEEASAAISEASTKAREWLQDVAPHRTIKYQRATDLWQRLIGPTGELRAMLLPAVDDIREDVSRVQEALVVWSSPDTAWERIREAEAQLGGRKSRPIVGSARQHLQRSVAEACDYARHWCDLVNREQEVHVRGDWLYEQVGRLRSAVLRELPQVHRALAVDSAGADHGTIAATKCLEIAIERLCDILDISTDDPRAAQRATGDGHSVERGLDEAVNLRLLWLPEVPLDNTGSPTEESLASLASALRDAAAERRTVATALTGWVDKQDYRFTRNLLDLVDDPSEAEVYAQQEQEALAGSRAALADTVDQANDAVEQALVDGIIADERSEYAALVDSIQPDQVLDCGAAFAVLRGVRAQLDERRRRRIEELQRLWDQAQRRLGQLHLEPGRQDRIIRFMADALLRQDSRVIEEGLARIKDAIEGGHALSDEFAAPADGRDVLDEFIASTPLLEGWLEKAGLQGVARAIRSGQTHAGIPFGEVPTARREEAAKAVLAWVRLKQVQRPGAQENPQRVATIMTYLGFSLERPGASSVAVQDRGSFWLHLQAQMSASDLARPIPQFGHLARGQYDILCLWERPGGDTIAARLRDLGLTTRTVIVLYLGRLTARQRRDVSRVCRQQELAVAILDETLLLFLTPTRDARMRTFLRCSLPYSVINPYTPFQAGDVPPEMFYGRESMGRELQNATGSCLLYGGRQLGKSALLRHVQRQFHRPDRQQFAWIENLKLVYDPHEGKDAKHLWLVLRDGFKRLELLSSRVHTERPEDIARHIRDCLADRPERRVLVMLDEADQFLDADARDDSRVVTGLDKLMLDTDRRFKVIFAGLHHVQRFHNIPNQQVGKFGAPQCVGPLEGRAAQGLVREPLETLGYRFEDNGVVLRILSYTNYHPGLIQLFCQELLREMVVRTEGLLPPYTIRREDVEAVYRHPYVRDRIRERFDWTLALDPRYQAITWSLIVHQMAKRDSYAEAFAPGNILEMAQQWWPQGFAGVENEEVFGLLEEMNGLGVLVRDMQGHYRLRSPNLVRLMGAEEDIEYRLLALSQAEPPPAPDANSHHGRLPDGPVKYSPLTFAQERALTPARYGVGILSASEAGGLEAMPAAFRRLLPEHLSKDELFDEIPPSLSSARTVRNWLARHERRLLDAERGVLYMRPAGQSPDALREPMEALIDFCLQYQTRVRWIRVVIALGPQATWVWLTLPAGLRTEIEDAADACTHSRPWTMNGVRQLLDQNDMLYTEEVCQEVLATTGGWHHLLQVLLDRARHTDDPRPVLQEMRDALADPGSELAATFRAMLGLGVHPAVTALLALLQEFPDQDIPIDLVTSDLVQSEKGVSPDDLHRAILFLERMGCVTRSDDAFRPNSLVGQLMSQRSG